METKNKKIEKEYGEIDFENDIFEVYASNKPKFGEDLNHGLALFCAESLAMRHYCYLETAKGKCPIVLDDFYNNYREDLGKRKMSAEDIFDKYYRKEMKEDYRNKVLEMINRIRYYRA